MTKARPFGLLVVFAALLVSLLGASSAHAEFGIKNWEALTCKENTDTPGVGEIIGGLPPIPQSPEQCTKNEPPEGPNRWFTQATGHPPFGITDFTLNNEISGYEGFPDGFVKDVVVNLPEGLGVNPEAAPACTIEEMETNPTVECPQAIVGTNYFTIAVKAPPSGECVPPLPEPTSKCPQIRAAVPVFNVEPFQGVPSMVAFPTTAGVTYIVGDLDPADQHIRFTISDIESPLEGGLPVVGSRLVFYGSGGAFGNGTYLTMPSNCAGGQTTGLHVDSHEGAEDNTTFTTAVGADECGTAPFEPALDTSAGSTTDSPEPATVDVQMPKQLEEHERAQSQLLKTTIALPDGTALNPSTANGLVACTDAQFKKGTDDPIECPAASRIGSVDVTTPALDQHLGGDVYVGKPLSNDPSSGEQFRIFIHAFNTRYGVNVRLIGHVFPNLKTGQLTVAVPENPQAPFSSFKVTVDGGPHGALSSPFICGPHTSTATYNPWSRPNEDVSKTSSFSQTTAPGGGACPNTLAERPFPPHYSAAMRDTKAGSYSTFELDVTRPDGAQELKRVDVTLPPGMLAKLRGVDYCPEDRILAAVGSSGADQLANPSCPASSQVGTVSTEAGTGSDPLHIDGKAYFAGPYKGAPVSLVIVTPAVAGPYDLGTVVVRTALYVDPETAQVHAVSDPIPDVFGGVRLDLRRIHVSLDRQGYTVNPTSCSEQTAIAAQLYGGGGDPSNEAAWTSVSLAQPYRPTDCGALKFKPKFYAKIKGGKKQTRRRAHPAFRAILDARNGDANLQRAAFILPHATILDQAHIGTICTRVQLASNSCPKRSIYGHAEATSPLINGKLKGPVYLTSSSHELPDLLVDLHGQVPIRLRGVISAVHGRLKTVFPTAPDAAVNKFILNMEGGNQGLLQNTVALCHKKRFAYLNLLAHNSRRMKKKHLRLNIPGCGKHGKKKHKK